MIARLRFFATCWSTAVAAATEAVVLIAMIAMRWST